jgi:hypothetical protein
MPQKQKINLAKIRGSLNTPCPEQTVSDSRKAIASVPRKLYNSLDMNERWAELRKDIWLLVLVALGLMAASLVAVGQETPRHGTLTPYVIVAHAGNDYTVRHGRVIMKVKYSESQTSTAKPGDFPGTGLHLHTQNGVYPFGPDLSQVPEVGLPIHQCLLSKTPDSDGDPVIAVQPTPEPCMMQNGNTLHYELSPNFATFTYVNFDIISERMGSK